MRFPIIKVRDKSRGYEHIVGTNSHDCLHISNGALHYLNIQCMCGTQYGEYEFVGEDYGEGSFTGNPEIEFMDLEEIIDLAAEHMTEAIEAKIKSYRALREMMEKELDDTRKETGIGFDTGGELY